MSEYLELILSKESLDIISEQERHLVYQLLIQHGLKIDETPENTYSSPIKVDQRNDSIINSSNLNKYSKIFYDYYPNIIYLISFELSSFLQKHPTHSDQDLALVKESLSSLSYLLSGLWISNQIKQSHSVPDLLHQLGSLTQKSTVDKLSSSLLALIAIDNPEIRIILLFLASKQQSSFLFSSHRKEWLQFLFDWIFAYCQAQQYGKLYQQMQIFSVEPSDELLYCLEAIDKLIQPDVSISSAPTSSSSGLNDVQEKQVTFLVNQFFFFNERIFNDGANGEGKTKEEIEERNYFIEEIRKVLFKLLYYLTPKLLTTHVSSVITKYKLFSPKFSDIWSKHFNSSSSYNDLLLYHNLWKLWIYLIFNSLLSFDLLSNEDLSSSLLKSSSPLPTTRQIILQFDLLRKQNLSLTELIHRLQSLNPSVTNATRTTVKTPTTTTTATVIGGISMKELLVKAIIADIIAPLNGVGIIVAPLQALMKISRRLTADAYYHLTFQMVRFQTWHVPNTPLKLILRCLYVFLFQPLPKQKILNFLKEQEKMQITHSLDSLMFDHEGAGFGFKSQKTGIGNDFQSNNICKDYILSIRQTGHILLLLFSSLLKLERFYVEDVLSVSVSVQSSSKATDLSRASSRNSVSGGNIPVPSLPSQISLIVLVQTLFQQVAEPIVEGMGIIQAEYEKRVFLEKVSILHHLQLQFVTLKGSLFQLYYNPQNASAQPMFPSDPDIFTSTPSEMSLNRATFQRFLHGGLFSFQRVFMKTHLLSSFQLQPPLSSLLQLSFSPPSSIKDVESISQDHHSVLEEIINFSYSCEQFFRLSSFFSQGETINTSFEVLSEELMKGTLVLWSNHIYLVTHALFKAIYDHNITALQNQQQPQQNTDSSSSSTTVNNLQPVHTSSSHHQFPFSLTPQKSLPHPQSKIISFTPIYQSTQISVTAPGPTPPPHTSHHNFPLSQSFFPIQGKGVRGSGGTSSQLSQQNQSHKVYVEQIILSSATPISSYLTWRILHSSSLLINHLIKFIMERRKKKENGDGDNNYNREKEDGCESSAVDFMIAIIENLFWFMHRTNGFHLELLSLMEYSSGRSKSTRSRGKQRNEGDDAGDCENDEIDDEDEEEDGDEDENYEDEIAAFKKIVDERSPATSQTFMQTYQTLATALQSISSPFSTVPTLPKSVAEYLFFLILLVDIPAQLSHRSQKYQSVVAMKASMLSTAIRRSMNAIIDSGVLPTIYDYLPHLLEHVLLQPEDNNTLQPLLSPSNTIPSVVQHSRVLFHRLLKPLPISLSGTLLLSRQILEIFFHETYQRLSQMMSPSLSEENNSDLMLTMTKGLKQIILSPLQYLIYHQTAALRSLFFSQTAPIQTFCGEKQDRKDETDVEGEEIPLLPSNLLNGTNESFQYFRELFLLYFTLQDLCYEKHYHLLPTTSLLVDSTITQGHSFPIFFDPLQSLFSSSSITSTLSSSMNFSLSVLLLLPRCDGFKSHGEAGDTGVRDREWRMRAEEDYCHFLALEKFYLLILEYSLNYQQKTKIRQQQQQQDQTSSISLMALQGYLFLFSLIFSLILSSSQNLLQVVLDNKDDDESKEKSESERKNVNRIIGVMTHYIKEYLSFLTKIMKELHKLLLSNGNNTHSTSLLPPILQQTISLQLPSSTSIFDCPFPLLCCAMTFFPLSLLTLTSPNQKWEIDDFKQLCFSSSSYYFGIISSNTVATVEKVNFLQLSSPLQFLLKSVLHYEVGSEELEKVLFSLYDSHYIPSTSTMLDSCDLRREKIAEKKVEKEEEEEQKEEAMIVDNNDDNNNNNSSKKRKFIEIHDKSALEEIIRNAEKKVVKQGILPVQFFSSSVDRQNRDLQSQDNHFSFSNSSSQLPPYHISAHPSHPNHASQGQNHQQVLLPPPLPVLVAVPLPPRSVLSHPAAAAAQNPDEQSEATVSGQVAMRLFSTSPPMTLLNEEENERNPKQEEKNDVSPPTLTSSTSLPPSFQDNEVMLESLMTLLQEQYRSYRQALSIAHSNDKVTSLNQLFNTNQQISSQLFHLLLNSTNSMNNSDNNNNDYEDKTNGNSAN